jgi:hypothetical protein
MADCNDNERCTAHDVFEEKFNSIESRFLSGFGRMGRIEDSVKDGFKSMDNKNSMLMRLIIGQLFAFLFFSFGMLWGGMQIYQKNSESMSRIERHLVKTEKKVGRS